ncbi:MAG: tyrosine-protein kinase domain-containing protein [Solirubrobacteraceae bacterium]
MTVVVACVAVAAIHATRSAKVYKATASVAFQSTSPANAALGVSSGGSAEPQREANTEVLKAHSPEVARKVAAKLGLGSSPTELLKEVQAEVAPTADVINIIAATGDPAKAANLANAFAEQYIAFKQESELSGISAAEASLRTQIQSRPPGSAERSTLEQSAQRLDELRATAGGSTNIIGRAAVPASPSGTTFATWIVIGLLAGIGTVLLLVFFLESLDRRLRSIEQFEREYRASALTVVPRSAFREQGAVDRIAHLEPYRMLRSALEFAAAARPLKTLLVTSAVAGEGKTTVAVDLAHTVALSGKCTILVEMDLRQPTIAQHFDLPDSGGLTAALLGSDAVEQLLVRPLVEVPQLWVLPAGRLPHNPAELLGSQRMTDVLRQLREMADIVILDMPPLTVVADAQIMLNSDAVDGALLVARVDRTRRDEVRRARAILNQHAVAPIGLVIAGTRGAHAYGGKYGYTTSVEREPASGAPRRRRGGEGELPGERAVRRAVAGEQDASVLSHSSNGNGNGNGGHPTSADLGRPAGAA